MKRAIALTYTLLITSVLVLMLGCASFSPQTTPTEEVEPMQTKLIQIDNMYWEVSLYSVKWDGAEATVNLSVSNEGDKPATFPYPGVHHPATTEFLVVDSYNQWFGNSSSKKWVSGDIYPGETRRGDLTFSVNLRSGNTALYVSWYSGIRRGYLFDIGHPK